MNQMKKKVLHLLESNRFSGAENVASQIIELYFDDPKYEMAYCSTDGPIRETIEGKNIPFFGMNYISFKEVNRVIKEYKPDIIHAHDMRASVIATIVGGKVPIVSCVHNNNYESRVLSLKSIVFFIASYKIRKIIWVSKSAMNDYFFSKYIKRKSIVMENIINEKTVKNKVKDDEKEYSHDIIFLGRITDLKNPKRLMSIISQIKEKVPDVKIAIVGTGDMEEYVKNYITQHELYNNVIMYGFQRNPYKILANSKMMIMTSKTEGIPMCVLEAQALGIPIVSTPVGGIPDVVVNQLTGFLTDSDAEFVEYACKILLDCDLRKSLSRKSIEVSRERNDINNYKNRLDDIYEECL